jgi:hypothetical protein
MNLELVPRNNEKHNNNKKTQHMTTLHSTAWTTATYLPAFRTRSEPPRKYQQNREKKPTMGPDHDGFG